MTFARVIRCAGGALVAAAVIALAAAPAHAATPSSALSASLGMRIDGALWHQHAGTFVAGAGDVNGDGLADVLVGTAEVHRIGAGLPAPRWNLYVVFGRRGARGRVVRLDRLGGGGLHLIRHHGGFSSGAGAGDVNGDGLADIVLGSAVENTRASAYVVFGRRRGGTVDVDRLGRGGFVVRTGANIESGPAVAGAGDLDRDGLADIVVGDPGYVPPGGEFGTGRAVVVFGRRGSLPVDLRHLGRTATAIIGPGPFRLSSPAGERLFGVGFGDAVAGVADLDGDGHRDVVVGAPFLNGREGGAFVVTRAWRRGATIDTRAPEHGWYRIAGYGANAAGWSLASAGDQNGDGLNDLLIGGYAGGSLLASSSGPSSAYVVYGSRAPHDLALVTLGASGVVLQDETSGDRAGQSVAGVGDVTGDARPDLLVGAPLADPLGVHAAGSAFLVPGGALAPVVGLRHQTASGARRFDGRVAYDTAGWSVAGLGDVNGDGARDIAVAAPRTDLVRAQSGSVYVIYGHARRP